MNPPETAAPARRPASGRLRAETAAQHQSAERHPFQQSLIRGTVSREKFAEYLGQMLLVHRSLDAGLRAAAAGVPAVARVVREHQYQEPYLLRDLVALGADPETVAPSPATLALLERLDEARPLALLGYHYVLEGSNNGSRYIAKAIRRALGIEGPAGLEYLDPYGPEQPARWAEFKSDLDAAGLSVEEEDELVAAAAEMFVAIGRISDDLVGEVVEG